MINKPKKILLTTHYQDKNQNHEYLGSDGLLLNDSYNLYLKKCAEFQAKAKKYKQENLFVKNSILHHDKFGYVTSEEVEDEVLSERNQHIDHYNKIFNLTDFNKDSNDMYQNVFGRYKKIRIIRELNTERNQNFSENFDTERKFWFTRYCTLSTFIQAARIIIVKNRLEKILKRLRLITPEVIAKIEKEIAEEKGEITRKEESEQDTEVVKTKNTSSPCKNLFAFCEQKFQEV